MFVVCSHMLKQNFRVYGVCYTESLLKCIPENIKGNCMKNPVLWEQEKRAVIDCSFAGNW